MKNLAHFFSFVFSPLLVPSYGVWLALWCSTLNHYPADVRWAVTGVTFLITCLFPLLTIFGMWKLGMVSDPGLNKRTERTVPYIITAISYAGCAFYLGRANAPAWLVMFMVGAFCAALVSIVVNLRWKISAHMAAMGGMIGMLFRIATDGIAVSGIMWVIIAAVLAAGAVGTSRVALERHTLMQVIAGTANGFVCVYFLSGISI